MEFRELADLNWAGHRIGGAGVPVVGDHQPSTRKLRFDYADQVAIQFAGTKKSLASGLPMAAVMFGSGGLGMLILPLMIFHQVQLIICSMRASTYLSKWIREGAGPDGRDEIAPEARTW